MGTRRAGRPRLGTLLDAGGRPVAGSRLPSASWFRPDGRRRRQIGVSAGVQPVVPRSGTAASTWVGGRRAGSEALAAAARGGVVPGLDAAPDGAWLR
jgi:hypothetical protein